jgi:2-alkenal reductase
VPVAVAPALPQATLDPSVLASFGAQEQVLIDLYRRVSPAVVNITVSAKDKSGEMVDYATGSGFVIDAEGHIVTNNHVVADAEKVRATFSDGTVLEAEVIGTDVTSDLAVIKVTAPAGYTLTALEMGDSDTLQVGQAVIAIGNPFGLTGTMTTGIVSAVGRTLASDQTTSAGNFSNPLIIQTDAAINPGNSGGPLLDSSGRVIGIDAAIRSTSGTNSGVGFAIPINTVKRIVPALIADGKYEYSYLGVGSLSVPSLADLALEYDVPTTRGVLVTQVVPGGPASLAGILAGTQEVTFRGAKAVLGGDIIIAIDGTPLASFDELLSYLVLHTSPGQQITLTLLRDGKQLDVPVTLGTRPTQ